MVTCLSQLVVQLAKCACAIITLAMQASKITDGVQQILQSIAAGKSEVGHSTQFSLAYVPAVD